MVLGLCCVCDTRKRYGIPFWSCGPRRARHCAISSLGLPQYPACAFVWHLKPKRSVIPEDRQEAKSVAVHCHPADGRERQVRPAVVRSPLTPAKPDPVAAASSGHVQSRCASRVGRSGLQTRHHRRTGGPTSGLTNGSSWRKAVAREIRTAKLSANRRQVRAYSSCKFCPATPRIRPPALPTLE